MVPDRAPALRERRIRRDRLRYTAGLMRRSLASAGVIALLTLGCSGPPTTEQHQAEGAIAAAREAGAEIYAPEDLQAAEAALQRYSGDVAQRDYRQALNDAQEARDRAYAAAKTASNEKAAVLNHANQLMAELDALIKIGNARLASTGPGPHPTTQAADRLRTALKAAPPAMQEARALLDQQDYRGALLRLTPVAEALHRELPGVDASAGRRGRE